MNDQQYWEECLSIAAEENDIVLSSDQLAILAEAASAGHENYGYAFYSPPASDRIHEIEREAKAKLDSKQRELDKLESDAANAIRKAHGLYPETIISFGRNGEVFATLGRTEQIQ